MREDDVAQGPDRFAPVSPEQFTPEQRASHDRILAQRGRIPAPFVPLLAAPALADAFAQWSAAFPAGVLSAALREAVLLCVAQRQACRYLWANHVDKARQAGLTEPAILALGQGQVPDAPTDVAAGVTLVTVLLDQPVLGAAQHDAAVAELTTRGVVELTSFCGFAVSVALLLKLRQPPLPDGAAVPF